MVGRRVWWARVCQSTVFAVALVGAPACNEEPAPVSAAKAYASAVQSGDTKRVLAIVDDSTAAYFEQAAARASDQIGGRRSVEPQEMLQVVDVDPRFQVAKAELVASTDDAATVELLGTDGSRHTIELVREEEGWKVVIPQLASLGEAP